MARHAVRWPATLVRRRPVAVAVGVVVAVAALRAVDVLVLGLHRRVGALALSSTVALALAAGYLRVADHPGPGGPGVDRRSLSAALVVGVAGVGAVQALAHGAEVLALGFAGQVPVVVVAPENPATGASTPAQVGAYLAFGVAVTAVGEELLFRRALLGAFAGRTSFRRANALQAALFGAWHFAWPLAIAVSSVRPFVSLWVYGAGLFVVTGTVGAVFGWLVRATGTVWTTVAAHALHNGLAVFVRVSAASGEVRGSALSATVVLGYVALAWLAWRRFGDAASRPA